MNEVKKNLARAKRSDLDAMQDRFEAIITVIEASSMTVEPNSEFAIIRRLASGDDLDSIIREAGIRALGLEQ